MGEVQVLEATRTVPNGRGRARTESGGLKVERIRVAAYCRVSTDGDEQLGSFESQKLYYEEKIAANSEWASAGIFADEAITGTKCAEEAPKFNVKSGLPPSLGIAIENTTGLPEASPKFFVLRAAAIA